MPDDADEEAIEKAKKELLVADPYVDLLCSPGTDLKIKINPSLDQPAWTVRLHGDATEYHANESYGTVVVRSLRWPGAYTFYRGGQDYRIYVGNGLKFEQAKTFYPDDPPLIEADPEEFETFFVPPKEEEVPQPEGEEGVEGEDEE
jgi:hypothetical protein